MNIYRKNYKLDLFSPANDYLGELEANNLDIELSYDDYSSISFTMPEKIGLNNELNEKIDITKEVYEIELSLGDLVNSSSNPQKIRFIITETDTSFSDDISTYRYSGLSKEFKLSMFQINSWQGLERFEYEFEVGEDIFPYDNTADDPEDTKYITISGDDLGEIQDNEYIRVEQEYYYDYELRHTTELIEIERTSFDLKNNTILDSEYMTEGYFFFNDDDEGSVKIKKPDIISETADVHYRYKVYYMPKNYEDQGINSASKHYFFSKDGLYPKELLENLLSFSNIEFTVDPIDSNINQTRSGFDFNEINVYEAIQKVAESFHAVLIFDTVQKTVSMRKQENIGKNKGLFIEYGKYLKDFSYSRNVQDFTTNLIPIGQDGLTISNYNPSGENYIEKYSFFQNSDWMSDNLLSVVEQWQNDYDSYLNLMLFDTSSLFSITDGEIAWYNDYEDEFSTALASVNLSDYGIHSSDLEGTYLFNAPISLNHEAILEQITKLETRVVSSEAKYNTYLNLRDTFDTRGKDDKETYNNSFYRKFTYPPETHADLESVADTTQVYQDIKSFYNDIIKHYQFIYQQSEMRLNRLKYILAVYSALIEDIHQKMDKKLYILELGNTDLEPDNLLLEWYQFQKQKTVHEDTITTGYDLLSFGYDEILDCHKPEFTFDVSLIDILNNKESQQDWDNLIVGDKINFKFDKFNINEEFQIKSISYAPDGQDLRFTLSNAYRYNKGFNRKVLNKLKDLSIDNKNLTEYLSETYKQLDNDIDQVKQQVEDIWEGRTVMEQEENGTVSIVDNSLEVSYKEPDESGNFLKEENGKLLLSSGGIHIYEPGKEIPSTAINVHGISAKNLKVFNTSDDPHKSVFKVDDQGNITFLGDITQGTNMTDEDGNVITSLSAALASTSASANYAGVWDNETEYIKNNERKDIVEYDGNFYTAKEIDENSSNIGIVPGSPDADGVWGSFGASFGSLATELAITRESIVKEKIEIGENGNIQINGSDANTPYISFGQNKEIDIVGQSTAPYISIGQNGNSGYANNGIYLGMDEVNETITPRFSVSTYPGGDRLTWSGDTLGIKGDLNLQTDMTISNIVSKGSNAVINIEAYPVLNQLNTISDLYLVYNISDNGDSNSYITISLYDSNPNTDGLRPIYTTSSYDLEYAGVASGGRQIYSLSGSINDIIVINEEGWQINLKMPSNFVEADMGIDHLEYQKTYEVNRILQKLSQGNDGLSIGSTANSYTNAASFDANTYVANLTGPGVDFNLDLSAIDTKYESGDNVNFGTGAFSSDLTVTGNLTVSGTTTTLDSETLEVEDNIILINKGLTSSADPLAFSGIEINRGTNDNYFFGIKETSNYKEFRIGKSGELQPLATRAERETLTTGDLLKWDDANNQFVSSGINEGITETTVNQNLAVSGNVTGANLNVSGNVTGTNLNVSGNVTGANLNASGDVDAIGNVTGANLNVSDWNTAHDQRGEVIAGTNLTWLNGNLNVDTLSHGDVDFTNQDLNTTNDVEFNNIIANQNLDAIGNVTGANLNASGDVAGTNLNASSNVTGLSANFENKIVVGDLTFEDNYDYFDIF